MLSQTFEGHVDILDDIIEVRSSEISAQGCESRPLSLRSGREPRSIASSSHLQTLVRELSEAELQSAQVRGAHLQKMEELRTQQEEQLELLQQLWDTNMQELISGFDRDRLVLAPTATPAGPKQICNTEQVVLQLNRGIVGNVVGLFTLTTNTVLRQ